MNIDEVTVSGGGDTISYHYTYHSSLSKFFKSRPHFYAKYEGVDLTNVPQHILVIPLLAQLLPIAWYAKFSVEVNSLDKTFYEAARSIKHRMPGSNDPQSDLIVDSIANDARSVSDRSLLLYSGGVDSVSSFIQHRSSTTDIASIFGADITLNNTDQWRRMKGMILTSKLLSGREKYFIESNLRDFYSYHVPLLLPDRAWWGKVQHGLGLTGLLAPITYLARHKTVLISSTYSSDSKFNWGSIPATDNLIAWNNTSVVHDSHDLKRTEKIKLIVDEANNTGDKIILRVCYSSKNTGINCSSCEKCYRTMLGLMVNGADPLKYGFTVSPNFYTEVKSFVANGFYSEGDLYFWKEIAAAIRRSETSPNQHELNSIADAVMIEARRGVRSSPSTTLLRQKIQLMFPGVTRGLIRLRNRLLRG